MREGEEGGEGEGGRRRKGEAPPAGRAPASRRPGRATRRSRSARRRPAAAPRAARLAAPPIRGRGGRCGGCPPRHAAGAEEYFRIFNHRHSRPCGSQNCAVRRPNSVQLTAGLVCIGNETDLAVLCPSASAGHGAARNGKLHFSTSAQSSPHESSCYSSGRLFLFCVSYRGPPTRNCIPTIPTTTSHSWW